MSSNENPDFGFDKFIKDIVKREENIKRERKDDANGRDESPNRKFNRLYREHPHNRIRVSRLKK